MAIVRLALVSVSSCCWTHTHSPHLSPESLSLQDNQTKKGVTGKKRSDRGPQNVSSFPLLRSFYPEVELRWAVTWALLCPSKEVCAFTSFLVFPLTSLHHVTSESLVIHPNRQLLPMKHCRFISLAVSPFRQNSQVHWWKFLTIGEKIPSPICLGHPWVGQQGCSHLVLDDTKILCKIFFTQGQIFIF